ncbi:endonuclease/exonuclease/phosphatase family protein [Actinopolymorpha pittospori]|uniref:Endonuclease/exonuclease/phosphatase domain-containing protein n=1 Tax=Actinopolymorpha pittospori TaxID=648752 RepID=A0A927N2C5_9ACTN|nr:endonuclease/exonuclease/phosphatase family protein [Actinopolymorpha pittospori]MBE1609013.1 hypothetical protein [Actinopolymorpha pittospori]
MKTRKALRRLVVLADLLDMHAYFSPVQEDSSQGEGLPRCQIGNAVFSRYPILEADCEILPWTLDYQRGVQDLLVNVRGAPLRIYNTHLQNNPTSPQAKQDRTDQVRAILACAGELEEPTVLTGDLNSNPDWSEIQPLFGVFGTVGLPAATVGPGTRWTVGASTTCCTRATSGCGVRRLYLSSPATTSRLSATFCCLPDSAGGTDPIRPNRCVRRAWRKSVSGAAPLWLSSGG